MFLSVYLTVPKEVTFSENSVDWYGMYGCNGFGQSSSSVEMSIVVVNVVDTALPEQISGPPKGWMSTVMSVPMLRAIMEGQSGLSPSMSVKCKLKRPLFEFSRYVKEGGSCCGPKGSFVIEDLGP